LAVGQVFPWHTIPVKLFRSISAENLLLLFLAFTILSSLQKPPTQDTTQSLFTEQPEAHIILTNLHCTPTPTTLRICGTTTWVGGSHAKAYIQGGIELQDLQAQYQQPFTSCQIIGYTEQPVTYTALLYDPSNNLLTSRTDIVTCPSPPQLPAQPYTHTKHLQFTTSSTNNRPDNNGIITVAFPDQLQSCTITGTYTFEDGGEKPGTKSYKSKQYCDGASGTFTGLLTPAYQSTVNDPHQFAWDDKQLTDPEPTTYLDYIIYARTCDTQYNLQERYFTSVRAIGLGTSTLDLYWNYKNDDTLPRVFFDTTFTCQLLPKP